MPWITRCSSGAITGCRDSRVCRRHLSFGCTASSVFLCVNTLVLGNTHRANSVLHFALAVSPRARVYLSHRFSFIMGSGSWTHRQQRHFTGRSIFDGCSSTSWHLRLSCRSDAALAEPFRCQSPFLMCRWRCSVFGFNRGFLSYYCFSRFMGVLFVARIWRSSFSEFPVGCVALRGRIFGNLFRTAANP